MKQLKYRSVFFDFDGNFSHFTYWGFLNHKDEHDEKCFKSPSSVSSKIRKFENQFTGKKDKHGKDIYEKDKLKDSAGNISVVEWIGGNWGYSSLMWSEKKEIVGNVYEN